MAEVLDKYNPRPDSKSLKKQRKEDYRFEPIEKIISSCKK